MKFISEQLLEECRSGLQAGETLNEVNKLLTEKPRAGEPVFIDGEWALIEKIRNEYHARYDAFMDLVILRFANGKQSLILYKDLP